MKQFFLTSALAIYLAAAAHAAEITLTFDPLTVKAGEEMRITLFNPSNESVELRIFAYNFVEGTYDERPTMVLPPESSASLTSKHQKHLSVSAVSSNPFPIPTPKPSPAPLARSIMPTSSSGSSPADPSNTAPPPAPA